MDKKLCPKCTDNMRKLEVLTALPEYTGESGRRLSDQTPAISLSSVYPLELYMCESCRFVELYAS